MRIFFDTEFIEDGRTIDLISIGMVREDGAELYLCNEECDLSRASDCVKGNVIPHLPPPGEEWVSRAYIAARVVEFSGDAPEFWAYYADYGWVVFCQLFGRMIDLPKGFPMYCRDIKQEADRRGGLKFAAPQDEHHALADARWNRDFYNWLKDI